MVKSAMMIFSLAGLISVMFITGCAKKQIVTVKPITIVFFGDSVTAGYGINNPAESFYGRIEDIMKKGVYDNIRTLNAGVNGDDTSDAFARIKEVRELRPDIVVIAFGLNDCQNDRITQLRFRQNLIRLTTAFPRETKVILATSNTFLDTGQDPWRSLMPVLDQYMDEMRKLAIEKKIPLIDVNSAWKKQLRNDSLNIEAMYIDPTHPSATGHRLYFETYMEALRIMFVR